MRKGLTMTEIGGDGDFEEYRIQASNGAFSGTVDVYAEPGGARTWARALAGSPRSVTDYRVLGCGRSGPIRAGGFAELRFSCRDTAGHAVVDLVLTSEGSSSGEPNESARFRIQISAAGVDQFVKRSPLNLNSAPICRGSPEPPTRLSNDAPRTRQVASQLIQSGVFPSGSHALPSIHGRIERSTVGFWFYRIKSVVFNAFSNSPSSRRNSSCLANPSHPR
jgi:hypothetical protein